MTSTNLVFFYRTSDDAVVGYLVSRCIKIYAQGNAIRFLFDDPTKQDNRSLVTLAIKSGQLDTVLTDLEKGFSKGERYRVSAGQLIESVDFML